MHACLYYNIATHNNPNFNLKIYTPYLIVIFLFDRFMISHKLITFVIVLLAIANCRFNDKLFQLYQPIGQTATPNFTQTQSWFTQLTDHYDYYSNRTWQQRYWVVDQFFNKETGPVLLYICG
jgi:hypothetical protein